MVGIIRYIGNVGSVKNALDYLEIPNCIVNIPEQLKDCTHIIIPGVGNWTEGVKRLKPFYKYLKSTKKPILGICLGHQLLARKSEEGKGRGLGLIKADIIKLDSNKLPHVGWAKVGVFNDYMGEYYFVHSYCMVLEEFNILVQLAEYEGKQFIATVEKGNVIGVQMHVEKSQQDGLNFIRRWYEKNRADITD